YNATISSHQAQIDSGQFRAVSADLDMRAAIDRDRILLQQIALKSGASTVDASGTLRIARPSADLHITAQIPGSEIAAFMKLPEVRGGHLRFSGTAHYDQSAGFMFNGKVAGRDFIYRSGALSFTGAEFVSDVGGIGQDLRFTHLS